MPHSLLTPGVTFQGAFSAFADTGLTRALPRDSVIYLKGQDPSYLYYLTDGRVKSVTTSVEGDEAVLALYGPGSIFGEASFFDGQPRVSTAITLTACQIRCLSRADVSALFARSPELALDMLRYLAGTVRLLSDHVDRMSFLSAEQRVASYLLARQDASGVIHASQEEIARSVGLNRVTVNRVLRAFLAAGMIRTGYRSLQICDLDALSARMER